MCSEIRDTVEQLSKKLDRSHILEEEATHSRDFSHELVATYIK